MTRQHQAPRGGHYIPLRAKPRPRAGMRESRLCPPSHTARALAHWHLFGGVRVGAGGAATAFRASSVLMSSADHESSRRWGRSVGRRPTSLTDRLRHVIVLVRATLSAQSPNGGAGPCTRLERHGSVPGERERGGKRMDDLAPAAARLRAAERIHIIGGPGSGKSTLAQRLGNVLGLPVHTLDTLAYEGPEFRARPLDVTARGAREIAQRPQWITEGIFLGWTEPLLRRADVIVWLDHATWRRSAGRIVIRSLRYAFVEMKARRGGERFLRFTDYARNLRQVFVVLVTSREYWHKREHTRRYPVTRDQVETALDAHAPKVLRVTRQGEAELLGRLVDEAARRPRRATRAVT